MNAGDVIKLPKGVSRTHGSWRFKTKAGGTYHHFCDKDYEKVIAHAEKYWAEHKKSEEA